MSVLIQNKLLNKGWKRFSIMHAEDRVASIREDGTCTIYRVFLMPYDLYLENADESDFEMRFNNLNYFYHWCASRVLTLDRKYAKEIFNSIGAKQAVTDRDRAVISISYHSLSLTDVYWVKQDRENVSFKDINLFNNSLSNAFADVSICGNSLTVQNAELIKNEDAAGDISTSGVAPKAWIRENGNIYLLKNGEQRDVEAELLASKIVQCFRVDSIKYTQDTFDNKKVSRSEIVTSIDKGIVPIESIDIYCANNNINRDEFVLSKDAYSFFMMNIVDYLVGNIDRHWGNWGFYVDNRTNKLAKLYPLMDFNKSFLSYDTIEGAKCLTNSKNQTQLEAAVEAVKNVGLNQVKDVQENWFSDSDTSKMFFARLSILKNVIR